MKRSSQLRRSGELSRQTALSQGGSLLKRSAPLQRRDLGRPAESSSARGSTGRSKQCDYGPRPRAAVLSKGPAAGAPASTPRPKFLYVRDERLRFMCGAMPCQHCGSAGPDAGVTWAHSNQSAHGKGRSIKASDIYVAALCLVCHVAVDLGSKLPRSLRVFLWDSAHRRTILYALKEQLWPSGVPLPLLVNLDELEAFRPERHPCEMPGRPQISADAAERLLDPRGA